VRQWFLRVGPVGVGLQVYQGIAGGDAGRWRTVWDRYFVLNGGNGRTEGFYGVKRSKVICDEAIRRL